MTDWSTERGTFIVHCGECRHSWILAYLPMEVRRVARLASHAHCPSCGAGPIKIRVGAAPVPFTTVSPE